MPTFSDGLLTYNSQHRVIICLECRYAVQKGALDNHLLRHKIYRGERRRLLECFSNLRSLDADDVPLPPPGRPPVDGLPVISGYKCAESDCGHLCASSKRMRKHWSDVHGVKDPSHDCGTEVSLQTFFRGAKLRYFEVASSSPQNSGPSSPSQGVVLGPRQSSGEAPLSPSSTPSWTIDIETLQYFHHFISHTYQTLPQPNYWSRHMVPKALQVPWLMCGLLTISAHHHLSSTSDRDNSARTSHIRAASRFYREFMAGWSQLSERDNIPDLGQSDTATTATDILSILRCSSWAFGDEPHHPHQDSSPSLSAHSLLVAVRAIANASAALSVPPTSPITTSDQSTTLPTIPALLDRIRSLPALLSVSVPKPSSAADFFACMAAVDALASCYAISNASEKLQAAWDGAAAWAMGTTDRFIQLVERGDEAALVIVAHWSVLLLDGAAVRDGCWFLKELGPRVARLVEVEVGVGARALALVQSLIPVHG